MSDENQDEESPASAQDVIDAFRTHHKKYANLAASERAWQRAYRRAFARMMAYGEGVTRAEFLEILKEEMEGEDE